MRECHNCHQQIVDDAALFCSKCGTRLINAPASPGATMAPGKKRKLIWFIAIPMNIALIAGSFFMVKGCSSVNGSLVAKGEPLGNFTFVPKQCRSGQRMNFFGSVLLGEGQQDGAVVAIIDPVKGKIIKVEIPGSCEPPDYEKCKEVIIDSKYCSRYDVIVDKIPVMINNIVLTGGRLNLDCVFPGGGTAKGEIAFERCN